MSTQSNAPLRRVSILAIDGVFASTLMQAKDFFHLASLRYGKQLGQGLKPAFETRLVSPDGQPVRSFSDVTLPVESALGPTDIIVIPAFWDNFDILASATRKYCPGCANNTPAAPYCAVKPAVYSGSPRQDCSTARRRPPTGASSVSLPSAFRKCCSTRKST